MFFMRLGVDRLIWYFFANGNGGLYVLGGSGTLNVQNSTISTSGSGVGFQWINGTATMNFTNTPIWGNPNAGSASPSRNPDGSVRTDIPNALNNFMSITGATAGRQFRFGLRVAF